MSAVEERRRKAREMREQEPQPTIREIAEELGVSPGTIHRDINPETHRRYLKRAREYKKEALSGNS